MSQARHRTGADFRGEGEWLEHYPLLLCVAGVAWRISRNGRISSRAQGAADRAAASSARSRARCTPPVREPPLLQERARALVRVALRMRAIRVARRELQLVCGTLVRIAYHTRGSPE